MSKHTTEGWEKINCNTSDLAEDWRIDNENMGCTSIIPISDGKKIIAFAVHHSYGYAKKLPELEAIADLIAAAPRLLKAAQDVLSNKRGDGDWLILSTYCEELEAAISQATGDSE